MDILADEGLPPNRMVLGHLDLVEDLDYHTKVVERGAYVQYDNVGRESYVEEYGRHWGHDDWRVDAIGRLVAAGFTRQILVSQDIALKTDLRSNGGIGYAHILSSVLPMMRRAGVGEAALHAILVDNPVDVLSIDWSDDRAPEPDVRQTDAATAYT
jgi:phosphotriesterase-related protein